MVLLFKGRDLGTKPPYRAGPDQLSAQGLTTAHRNTDKAVGGGELGISSAGGGNGGSGLRGDWGLRHEEEEYDCTIYLDATDYGPL